MIEKLKRNKLPAPSVPKPWCLGQLQARAEPSQEISKWDHETESLLQSTGTEDETWLASTILKTIHRDGDGLVEAEATAIVSWNARGISLADFLECPRMIAPACYENVLRNSRLSQKNGQKSLSRESFPPQQHSCSLFLVKKGENQNWSTFTSICKIEMPFLIWLFSHFFFV